MKKGFYFEKLCTFPEFQKRKNKQIITLKGGGFILKRQEKET
ncbi:hypothetical protein M089_0344 [Bacteroides ovatus str. 3725 D9 iii]|nr:hypothetical protein M089_0344 [Bacteroides ovatus str. 3725 D9 iii]